MFDFLSLHFYIAVLLSVANGIMLCYIAYKFFHILQLSSYRISGYFEWLKDTKAKYVSRLFMLCFLSSACLIVTNVLFDAFQSNKYFSYLGLTFYFVFCVSFIILNHEEKSKVNLKFTKRMNRLIYATFFISSILTFLLIWLSYSVTSVYRFSVVAITPMMIPLIVPFVHFLTTPLENAINNNYIKKAKVILNSMPNLIKIGVTGSYGKTSLKFILSTMLKEKYNVCFSPNSYNTPMGLCKTIRENLRASDEVLICEMGAIKTHEIRELCKFICPSIGAITSVGNQHLQTFRSLENIKNTKYEIVQYLTDDGIAIFNGDNQIVKELYNIPCDKQKIITGIGDKNFDVFATDIKCDCNGTSFVICVKNGDKMIVETKLLGEHNVQNILMAVAICLKLKLSLEQIKIGIAKLEPVEHRLQLINLPNGAVVIDDSFNASEASVESALEILEYFDKRRKIIVTPGIIDLGNQQQKCNEDFATKIEKNCDMAIIVNKTNRVAFENVFNGKKFDIKYFDTLNEAKDFVNSILNNKDVVLYENDLPDNYI